MHQPSLLNWNTGNPKSFFFLFFHRFPRNVHRCGNELRYTGSIDKCVGALSSYQNCYLLVTINREQKKKKKPKTTTTTIGFYSLFSFRFNLHRNDNIYFRPCVRFFCFCNDCSPLVIWNNETRSLSLNHKAKTQVKLRSYLVIIFLQFCTHLRLDHERQVLKILIEFLAMLGYNVEM